MTVADIIRVIEDFAHPSLQEEYDNSGLLLGSRDQVCTGVICSLDVTEHVINEAVEKGANLIVAHHPIIFKGLKTITGGHYVDRTILHAIKNNVVIYAAHTNLDNVQSGVNGKMAEIIGLTQLSPLEPKTGLLRRLVVYVPSINAEAVMDSLFREGAGNIGNYSECSFQNEGIGTFKPGAKSDPHTGTRGERFTGNEVKLEVVFPVYLQNRILTALRASHPYEEIAYGIYQMENSYQDVGSGLVGHLASPMKGGEFLELLKSRFLIPAIKHSQPGGKTIQKVALCGGAGSFLIQSAIRSQADVFVTADLKYHDFFEADGQILLADIGHYESEQFTSDLLRDLLLKNFPTFAVLKSGVNTNPVRYFL